MPRCRPTDLGYQARAAADGWDEQHARSAGQQHPPCQHRQRGARGRRGVGTVCSIECDGRQGHHAQPHCDCEQRAAAGVELPAAWGWWVGAGTGVIGAGLASCWVALRFCVRTLPHNGGSTTPSRPGTPSPAHEARQGECRQQPLGQQRRELTGRHGGHHAGKVQAVDGDRTAAAQQVPLRGSRQQGYGRMSGERQGGGRRHPEGAEKGGRPQRGAHAAPLTAT